MKKFITTKWGLIFLAVSIIILFFIFTKFNVFSFSEGISSYSLSPVQSFFNNSTLKLKNFFNYFGDINDLKKENNALKNDLADLTSENVLLTQDLTNYNIIQSEYGFITNYEIKGVLAKIISRGSDNYLQSLIINKGTKDGIQNGYPVTAEQGYVIGKIVEVNEYTSKVLLLNDIHSKLSISVNNDQNSPGIINGEFGLSLKISLIPYDHIISEGDIVLTSGLEKNIPANLIVGKISKVSKNEGELFQTADVDYIINYENLVIVTVILPTND